MTAWDTTHNGHFSAIEHDIAYEFLNIGGPGERPFVMITGYNFWPSCYRRLGKELVATGVIDEFVSPHMRHHQGKPFLKEEECVTHACGFVKSFVDEGPFVLAGHSWGGAVAMKTTTALEREGKPPAAVVLVNPALPRRYSPPELLARALTGHIEESYALDGIVGATYTAGLYVRRLLKNPIVRWRGMHVVTRYAWPEPVKVPALVLLSEKDRLFAYKEDDVAAFRKVFPHKDTDVRLLKRKTHNFPLREPELLATMIAEYLISQAPTRPRGRGGRARRPCSEAAVL